MNSNSKQEKEIQLQQIMLAAKHVSEIVEVVELFEDVGIDVMVLKGEVLSQYLYGDPTYRQSGDIDFLVRTEDLLQAHQILIARGYISENEEYFITPKRLRVAKQIYLHTKYFFPKKGVIVEMHWKPFLSDDLSLIWEETQHIEIAGKKIKTLSPVNTFVYLAMHGCRHRWERELWLQDLRVMIENDLVGPEAVWEKAVKDRLHRPVAQAFVLLSRHYHLELPEFIRNAVSKSLILRFLIYYGFNRGVHKRKVFLSLLYPFFVNFYYFFLVPTLAYKRNLLRSWMTTSLDWEVVELSDEHFWMYFFLRPYFWLRRKVKKFTS